MTTDFDADHYAVLRRLAAAERDSAGGTDPSTLAAEGDRSAEAFERTLSDLADDGLVAPADEGYELTPSGRRVLQTDAGVGDESRPDVPPEIAREIASFGLAPDAEDAVFRALAFLRNWGSATANEIIDAAYSEAAAGYDRGEAWWDELVRDRLAELPGVVPPADEGDGGDAAEDGDEDRDDRWRYEGDDASIASAADGRRVFDADADRYGSARHAIERGATTDAEADALSAAFETLATADAATTDELAAAADEAAASEVEFDRLADELEAVPGVERDGVRWRYVEDDRFWPDEAPEG